MPEFGRIHLHKSFSSKQEEYDWWAGRLVRVRSSIGNMFIKSPPVNEIGIVTEIYKTSMGDYIKIYFPSLEQISWMMVGDVFTMEDKK